jgi:hypothetical protein
MDPLSALSLAAAIAQFVEYGSKIVYQAKEIAESGSSVNVQHLSKVTSDLVGMNSSLNQQLKADVTSNGTLTKEAQVRSQSLTYSYLADDRGIT